MSRPFYVDLDHTLIRTDILWEMAARLVCRKPWLVPGFLLRCLGDRAGLKDWLAGQVEIPCDLLPWNEKVVDFIKEKKSSGDKVYLATATHESIAGPIAAHLGLFDGVLATNAGCNLKGKEKLKEIQAHSAGLGAETFAYVGDSTADIPVWMASAEAWIVPKPGGAVVRTAGRAVAGLQVVHPVPRSAWLAWLRLLRPQQWSKNSLLFLPLILAHKVQDVPLLVATALAFLAFSLTASAVYVFNDFADVFRDRAHPRKKTRPLASGDVPLWQAPVCSGLLVILAAILAATGVGNAFTGILALYLASNVFYTFWLKHHPMVDVVALAMMYSLRIFAGGVATGLEVSKWLLAFSMFFFLSLAFGKRYQEIAPLATEKNSGGKVRGYLPQDLPVIGMGGLSAGFLSVLVLALYVRSPEVLQLYTTPDFLWLLCPLAIYWVGRFWLLTGRGLLHDDPVVFALKDKTSWIVGLLILVVLTAAQILPDFL